MTEDPFAQVQDVIRKYFDGLYFCDVEILKSVFHPKAIYATADEENLLHRTMDEYFPVVAARQSSASRGEARRDHVDAIQFAGRNTAFARVRCSIADRDFVDFLTLVRTDGRWCVMSKVFQIIHNDRS